MERVNNCHINDKYNSIPYNGASKGYSMCFSILVFVCDCECDIMQQCENDRNALVCHKLKVEITQYCNHTFHHCSTDHRPN